MPLYMPSRVPHLNTLSDTAKMAALKFIAISLTKTAGTDRVLTTLALAASQAQRNQKRRQA